MKRFALAAGLAAAAAPAADAGYLVVRVLLDGSGGGAAAPTAPGPGGPGAFDPRGGGQPRPGGGGPGALKPGMMGGGGAPGMPLPGGMGFPGASGAAPPPAADPSKSIFVVIPYTQRPAARAFYPKFGDPNPKYNPQWGLGFTHPYGYTNLFVDNSTVQAYTDLGPANPGANKTRQSLVVEKHEKWVKNPADAQILLDLVTEALEYGMAGEAVKYADELLAAVAAGKARTTPSVLAFAGAYGKLQKPLKDLPAQRGDGDRWAKQLSLAVSGAKAENRNHFTLVYWDASEQDRTRRFAQLEDNLRAFYLWHATRGQVLPLPERPLTAVLPRTTEETITLARSLDHYPVLTDSFYVPEYDVLVLAPDRIDEVGKTFRRQTLQTLRNASKVALLDANTKPVPVPIDTTGQNPDALPPEEIARMMTYAMVDRYAADATELQAVSREGSRQLLYAAGLLPRHVSLPQWLSGGSVGFYQRPRGPVFTTKEADDKTKQMATVALTTGYGVPNFVAQRHLREMLDKKQLNADPGLTLRHVVTDAYFGAIDDRLDADDPQLPLAPTPAKKAAPPAAGGAAPPFPGAPGSPYGGAGPFGGGGGPAADAPPDPLQLERRKQAFLVHKAYATAWALYYYLAKNHPDGLARYTAELARMPRDLPLDEPTRLALFARAFNLTTGDAPEAGRKTFKEFGQGWLRAMDALPPAGVDIELTEPVPPSAGTAAGMPGMPAGGLPGFPPPGNGGTSGGDGIP